MKSKTIIVVLLSLLIFSFATSSHAMTITGSETVTTNSSMSYSASDCDGTVTWSVTGTGASISSNGVLTTGSASCGGITVTARCSDGTSATKTVRVSNAGQWVLLSDEWRSQCINDGRSCACANSALSVITEIRGKNKYTEVWASHCIYPNTPDHTCPQTQQCFAITYTTPPSPSCGQYWAACGGNSSLFGMFVYHQMIYEWKCPSCTNGQTISCYTGMGGTQGVGECKAGTQICVNGQWGACQGEILPSAEICGNDKDENCDGNKDEGCAVCEVSVNVSPLAVWPQKTESAETTAIVTVSPTKPVPPDGCNIKLSVEPVENSGGHIHNGGRNNHKGTINPSTFTISAGIVAALFTYKSSEVAGIEKIKVEANGKEAGEAIIRVQVPGLQPLSGGYYFLKCVIEPCQNYKHEDFYNVQSWVNGLFNKIAYSYHQKFPTSQILVVTDASLAYGGLYDYQNTWAPPHKTHRVGTDIDVRSKNISERNRTDFKKIVCKNSGFPKLEFPDQTNEHYHLYFFPYKSLPKNLCKGEEIPI